MGALAPAWGQLARVEQFGGQDQAFGRGGDASQAVRALRLQILQQEQRLGLESLQVASSLHQLGQLYGNLHQPLQAEPLLLRSLAISEQVAPPYNPLATANLKALAKVYLQLGRTAKAQARYDQLLVSLRKQVQSLAERLRGAPLAPDILPFVLNMLNDLAPKDMTPGQLLQAQPFYEQVLQLEEQGKGNDLFPSLVRLAEIHRLLGQYPQANVLLQRARLLEEPLQIPRNPRMAGLFHQMALLHRAQGQNLQALEHARAATAIYQQRILQRHAAGAGLPEASSYRQAFLNHMALLAGNPAQEQPAVVADEAFQLGQLTQTSTTAAAVAQLAARFASGNDSLADLIRKQQDSASLLTQRDALLLQTLGLRTKQRDADAETALRAEISALEQDIAHANAERGRLFPGFQELTQPDLLQTRAVQSLLKADEALLAYTVGSTDSFLAVATAKDTKFMSLQLDSQALATAIATVRAEMEPNETGQPQPVSTDLLHQLYQQLVGPALPLLHGVQHLVVVPDGALQSLPFGMLVASPYQPRPGAGADYGRVDWLVQHHAVSVLPSVGALRLLRVLAQPSKATQPFAGFGDPLLGKPVPSGARTLRGIDMQGLMRKGAMQATELADVDAIRELPRLAETATELQALARASGAKRDALWLGERATESQVKSLDLSQYRILAFATHAVMAGEMNGLAQPGLVLTPPAQASADDDGYLTAGEIAALKLNADWVLLSACNTAAPDGTPGAEGFSGLTKAFIYAGARSLMVSHWSVESKATVQLSTGTLKAYESKPSMGKAAALRASMLSLIRTPGFSHPLYWAPFVLVGEGSR